MKKPNTRKGSASEMSDIVPFLTFSQYSCLVDAIRLSVYSRFIPVPIGMVYSPATTYPKPDGSVMSREEVMVAPSTHFAVNS
jgi:hypothetical protein